MYKLDPSAHYWFCRAGSGWSHSLFSSLGWLNTKDFKHVMCVCFYMLQLRVFLRNTYR